MRRKPAVAGYFYPSEAAVLRAQIAHYLEGQTNKRPVMGVVSPHAGIVYSGAIAGAVYAQIQLPEVFVLLGPNHTGQGDPLAVISEGEWETPLGVVPIDQELAAALRTACPLLREDTQAHVREHSLEMQLPFLQALGDRFRIVPLVLGPLSYEVCQALGHAIAQVVQQSARSVVIVASTDMTHCGRSYRHLPPPGMTAHDFACQEDRWAIDRITALDPRGLYQVVRERTITMCGILPTTVTLLACQELGTTAATLVRYMTSGEVSGDLNTVVGYAGFIIE
ncbi:MAG: AmmeMemoRadiSam system protein B [Nitrospinae bacterium]|nr:AmmeMemoRadiSam system protein B [Nitrospinota bacterium]